MFDSLEKLLKDKKVVDAYTYYVSCAYKLYFVRANADALRKIINDYQNGERAKHQKVFEDAINKGVGHYISEPSTVDFFGVTLDSTVAIDKLTMESLSLLHSKRSIIPRYRKAVVPGTHTAENHDLISSDQGSRSSTSKSLLCSARSGNMLSR